VVSNLFCESNTTISIESKANKVYERVLAVSDKSTKLYPILNIVENDNLIAHADQSGRILISKKAIQLCYKDVKQAVGDARLAFLFAHEMTHLAKNHFALKKKLSPNLKCEMKKNIELDADANALIIVAMAKYNPFNIFDSQYSRFIHKWVALKSKKFETLNHCYPSPDERLHNLENEIKMVQDKFDLFNTGLRLYQVGKFDDALQFFIEFSTIFPCREVHNNIGLIYYQKAIKSFAEYDFQKAYQFMLSTALDTTTLADIFNQTSAQTKGNDKSKRDEFKNNLKLAKDRFKLSCFLDQTYLPAYINLSSVDILNQEYDSARYHLNEFKKKHKKQKNDENYLYAVNNEAILLYKTVTMAANSKSKHAKIKQSIDLLKNGIHNKKKYLKCIII
jgi:hypothetical protein